VGEAVGDGGDDGDRLGAGRAVGAGDRDTPGVAAARVRPGEGRADARPRGLPCGAALGVALPGSAAEQLTMPQPLATRRRSGLCTTMNPATASAARPVHATSTPYHRYRTRNASGPKPGPAGRPCRRRPPRLRSTGSVMAAAVLAGVQ
jgi:hypothetical protein